MHRRTHPNPVEGCFGCKIGRVTLATANLERDRANHTTQQGVEKEIVDAAKADGRDLARPADFPHFDWRT